MKAREVIKRLRQAGWTFGVGGKHQVMGISPDGKIKIPIPYHGSKDIKIGTLKAIEKSSGVKMQGG